MTDDADRHSADTQVMSRTLDLIGARNTRLWRGGWFPELNRFADWQYRSDDPADLLGHAANLAEHYAIAPHLPKPPLVLVLDPQAAATLIAHPTTAKQLVNLARNGGKLAVHVILARQGHLDDGVCGSAAATALELVQGDALDAAALERLSAQGQAIVRAILAAGACSVGIPDPDGTGS